MEGVSSAFKKVMESEEKNKKSYKYKPPDGGWGWIIVISFAIQNMILLPVLINFGLMFRGVFAKLKMTTTDSSIIINCNSASGLLFGLLNGPLLKTFGFRKIACIGALLTFFGNSMTSFATTPIEFIVYYGIISSIGVALVMASFSLALNTYFVERRGIATGVAMSFTGLGPVFMPLLISKLMAEYGGRGTALIMAGLTLHSFVGALLLQPVKWHRRRVDESDPNNVENAVNDNDQEMTDIENGKKKLFENSLAVNNDSLVKRRFSDITPLRGVSEKGGSVHSLNVSVNEANKVSANGVINEVKSITDKPVVEENDPLKIKYNVYKVNENDKSETIAFLQSDNDGDSKYHEKEQTLKNKSNNGVNKKKSWRRNIIEIFDLDLLNEPVFRSIWIGMSIAFTAEMNFTLMTPFILGDMGYNTQQTAKMMSIMGVSDILSRLICPFIGSKTKLPARFLYIVSLCILVTFRFCLTVVESDWTALFVFIGLGLGKGFLSVYRALVVPNHVPLEKLASASGLQTVLNGIFLMSFGPILGHIKDKLGNYDWYIYVLNILTLITITMWVIEFTIRILRQRKSGR